MNNPIPIGMLQGWAKPLINTGALARCQNVPALIELFQQFIGYAGKPLKRLILRLNFPHRAKAPVLMRGCWVVFQTKVERESPRPS